MVTAEVHFYQESALLSTDKAFDRSIYAELDFGVDNFEPKVISSPLRSGKTTLSNYIAYYHQEYAEEKDIKVKTLDLPGFGSNISKARFRELFASILESEIESFNGSFFIGILQKSKWLGEGRHILMIQGLEHLDEEAIHWLLKNLRTILDQTNPIFQELSLQILIEGNYIIQNLTGGLNSLFPLRHIYPNEFDKAQLTAFISERSSFIFEKGALNELWIKTEGDKYIVQSIMIILHRLKENEKENTLITRKDISLASREYVTSEEHDDFLRKNIREGFYDFAISREWLNSKKSLPELLRQIGEEDEWVWEEIPKNEQNILFSKGLVRKNGDIRFHPRAPIIFDLYESSYQRMLEVRELLFSEIPFDELGNLEKEKFLRHQTLILEAAFKNSLKSLHCGLGYSSADNIQFTGVAWNHGPYEGIWDFELGNKYGKNSEYWCLLYTISNSFTSRVTRSELLPI